MSLNLDELREEQSRLENSNSNSSFSDNFVKMPDGEGTVVVRLLPPKQGSKFYCVTRTHRLGSKTLHSLMNLVGGRWEGNCPIYNYYKRLWQEADKLERNGNATQAEALRTEARTIKPLERYYYNCVVRYYHTAATGTVKPSDSKVKILSVGKQLHGRIIRSILGDPVLGEEGLGDVSDIKTGRDLMVVKRLRKSGAEAFPNYDDSKFKDVSVLGSQEEIAAWISQLHDLQSLRQLKPYEELQRELDIYRGISQDPSTQFSKPSDSANFSPISNSISSIGKTPGDNESESLADDEFLRALKNM